MDHKIDINTASLDDLARLQGIGEKLAERIIEYRQTVHPFEEVMELADVPGISEQMVREVADQLTVDTDMQPKPDAAGDDAEEDEDVAPATDDQPEPEDASPEMVEQVTLLPAPATDDETSEPAEQTAETRITRSSWWSHLLSAAGGALLALLVLLLINGTLEFTGANRAGDLQRQVDQQRLDQSRLGNDLDVANDRLATVDAAQARLRDVAGTLDSEVQALQEELETSVDALQGDTEQLSERLDGVAQAADNFDVFLDSMRDLLITLQGLPPSATPTPTLTRTPRRSTPAPAGGTETTPSPTSAGATRTPRPTATPIVPTTPGATP
jgi:competence ComEA-like helix-hairpin-helix protein